MARFRMPTHQLSSPPRAHGARRRRLPVTALLSGAALATGAVLGAVGSLRATSTEVASDADLAGAARRARAGLDRPSAGPTAQRWMRLEPNVPYDGRFTFARIRYTEYRSAGWAFDYPTMERHLMLMVQEITEL